MLIVVNPSSGVPVYRQLMDQIRFQITSGVLQPGTELPSTRALSLELGVNPMTISKAYSYLEREQVIERRPGRPLIVRALPKETLQDDRLRRLAEVLTPVVTQIRQLRIPRREAVRFLDRMLREAPGGGPTPAPDSPGDSTDQADSTKPADEAEPASGSGAGEAGSDPDPSEGGTP